ncbi:hypothetical protein [Roseateles sp. BYS96W]|uniref:Meckel syndrome type 1 protein n=1 Tax=Pelomonas nitida TaxID=3299027 RepID=A0ABW7G4J8_9BURK
MAATATSPMLDALVERLWRPLARATDDALRRLDLAIAPDDDVSAPPAVPDAALEAADDAARGIAASPRHVADTPKAAGEPLTAIAPARALPPTAARPDLARPAVPTASVGGSLAAVAPPLAPPTAVTVPPVSTSPAGAPPRSAPAATTGDAAPSPPSAAAELAEPRQAWRADARPASVARPSTTAHTSGAVPERSPRRDTVANERTLPRRVAVLPHAPAVAMPAAAVAAATGADRADSAVAPPDVGTAPQPASGDRPAAPVTPARRQAPARLSTATRLGLATLATTDAAPTRAPRPVLRVAPRASPEWGSVPDQMATGGSHAAAAATALPPPAAATPEVPEPTEPVMATSRPLRLVANRLDRAMAPVFSRALDTGALQPGDDDMPEQAAPRISNTFNVNVALGGAAGALEPRKIEEALGEWLRACVRRQGLLP